MANSFAWPDAAATVEVMKRTTSSPHMDSRRTRDMQPVITVEPVNDRLTIGCVFLVEHAQPCTAALHCPGMQA
jgi:hypothetical protein